MTDGSPEIASLLAAGSDSSRAHAAAQALMHRASISPSDRQSCANELCAWLRMVWAADPASCPPYSARDSDIDALARDVADFLAARLMDPDASGSFCRLDLDLSGTIIREFNFAGACFDGGNVDFRDCVFHEKASFAGARFTAGRVLFDGAKFHEAARAESARFARAVFGGAAVSFESAEFKGGVTCFADTQFTAGEIRFNRMKLTDSLLLFGRANFSGAKVTFTGATFDSGSVSFHDCKVTAGFLGFERAKIGVRFSFDGSIINGGHLSFDGANIGFLSFSDVKLISGAVTLRSIFVAGGDSRFDGMSILGGEFILDEAKIPFGHIRLDRASFAGGSVSLEDIVVEFEGVLDLPWGRYNSAGGIQRDNDFDGSREHVFYQQTAKYAPGAQVKWGRFRPGSTG
jgi:uncharacterized protein YjbI with pentapeptide repeats